MKPIYIAENSVAVVVLYCYQSSRKQMVTKRKSKTSFKRKRKSKRVLNERI